MSKKQFDKTREAKKALITESPSSRKNWVLAVAACALLVTGGAAAVSYMNGADGPNAARTAEVSSGSDHVSHELALFADGRARHFTYQQGPVQIRYFILKSSDGVVRAAFDACDVCWPAGKGYYQDGDEMVCRNCGNRFASARVNEVKGGCNPAPLTRSVKNDQVVIRINDIVPGGRFFDFKKQV